MSVHGRKNADDQLILALARGTTVAVAAEVAGVAERTVYRRLNDEAFRCKIRKTRAEFTEQAVAKLSDAATQAVETIVQLLEAKSDSVKLQAARSILDSGVKLREVYDLEQRILSLEKITATHTDQ